MQRIQGICMHSCMLFSDARMMKCQTQVAGEQDITAHALAHRFRLWHSSDLGHCLDDGASALDNFVAVATRMEKNLEESALQAIADAAQGQPKGLTP